MKMTCLYFFNFCILQWFGVRLARVIDSETGGRIGWTWIFVLPLTGWWNDYVFWHITMKMKEVVKYRAEPGTVEVIER